MTDTIVRNSSPTVPIANLLFVHGYDASVGITTVLHEQLHGSGFNAVYRPARKRAGTMSLLFATAADAWAAVALLSTSYSFTLTADVPELSMTFALRPGDLRPINDPGFKAWSVEVPFQEL